MYRSILVPLDGSTFAEHALPTALALARRGNARLLLVTVSTPLSEAYVEGLYFSTLDLEKEQSARLQGYVEEVAKRVADLVAVPVVPLLRHGEVAPVLTELLQKGEADLVVMATHARGAFGRFWLGSVSDELIRHTHVPLLLIRPEDGPVDLRQEPSLTRMVLSLDGSELSEKILRPAVELAEMVPDLQLILIRAVQSVAPIAVTPDVPEAEREARSLFHQVQVLQAHLRETAERYLEGIAEPLRARGIKVRTHVITEDQPAEAILQEIDMQHADLVALETHGRSGLARLFLGSTTERVIQRSPVPVLVHRPGED